MCEQQLNVLITGASGLLGRTVYKYFKDGSFRSKYPINKSLSNNNFSWNCLGLCNSRVRGDLRKLDISNYEQVENLLIEFKPNVVIHCAAIKKVETVENDFSGANSINQDATQNLAKICSKQGIVFIYISTDYVFDGKNPPYKINDATNPLNKYGISKLNGERVTIKDSDEHIIVRVPVLYGQTEPNEYSESAVNILVEKIRLGKPYKIDHTQIRFPTHCIDVARFLMQIILKRFAKEHDSSQIKGIFHCTSLVPYTKYEMSLVIAEVLELPKDHIQPDNTIQSDGPNLRPQNAQLESKYSYGVINFEPVVDFKKSIKECLEVFV